MSKATLTTAILTAAFSTSAAALDLDLTFTKLWTYSHTDPDQVSEIPAYDARTHTIWVAGVVGVDVLNADTGAQVAHIDVTPFGHVNSVAIHNGLAAFAVEVPEPDRRDPGSVLFYNTTTQSFAGGVFQVPVGSLPDMLTFTPDGKLLLVANEGTPNDGDGADYDLENDPPGSVSIIDVAKRKVIATAGFDGVPIVGDNVRLYEDFMDFEPEYIAVDRYGLRAFVTLQEGNAIGVLDLVRKRFVKVIGLGAKDFSVAGNEIDPFDEDGTDEAEFATFPGVKGLYMPDGIATYQWFGLTLLVMANEGDFREDDGDLERADEFGATGLLERLRVSTEDSEEGNLFAAGGRSFSIRAANGALIWDSGSILDRKADELGLYDEARSDDKGVEPEGVALLDLGWKTYAFVGLERTTQSAVVVFDISNPFDAELVDTIVTDTDLAPEGLAVFARRGKVYLAIANETPIDDDAQPTDPRAHSNTTLYRIDFDLVH